MKKGVYYFHKTILINNVTFHNVFIMFYGGITDDIPDL